VTGWRSRAPAAPTGLIAIITTPEDAGQAGPSRLRLWRLVRRQPAGVHRRGLHLHRLRGSVSSGVLQGRAQASGRSLEDVTADALSIQALKYFVDPDDIAALALFLASDRARSISGQTIAIDGFSKAAQ
jgi:hypothetical protein